jgi:heat shock protein HtpX
MKRIVFFLATNLAVVFTLGVIASVFGLDRFLVGTGLDMPRLLAFSALFGFGGAIVSLLLSKGIAKWTTGARVLAPPRTEREAWLVATVARLAEAARIGMPEVAIYEGSPNAFATGAFRDRALVAVSTELLAAMTDDEIEAVLGHEIAHVANGDMVTLTLIQGVLNTFVIFASRALGFAVDAALGTSANQRRRGPGITYHAVRIVLEVALGLLAAMVVAWFSRQREFRADRGSARLLGSPSPLVKALARLHGAERAALPGGLAAFGIAGGIGTLLATHPPIAARIQALQGRGR